jgi:hypothetical protein
LSGFRRKVVNLDIKGVRSGDHHYLMQPICSFWFIGDKHLLQYYIMMEVIQRNMKAMATWAMAE